MCKATKTVGALELAQWDMQGTLAKQVQSIVYRAVRSTVVIGAMLCSSLGLVAVSLLPDCIYSPLLSCARIS